MKTKFIAAFILVVFLLCLTPASVFAIEDSGSNNSTEDHLNILERIYTDYQYSNRLDDLAGTAQPTSDISIDSLTKSVPVISGDVQINDSTILVNDPSAELIATIDESKIEIKDINTNNYLYDVAVNYSVIEPMVQDGQVHMIHTSEDGTTTTWQQNVSNVSGYAVFGNLPFSTVTITYVTAQWLNWNFETWNEGTSIVPPSNWTNYSTATAKGISRGVDGPATGENYSLKISGNNVDSEVGHIYQVNTHADNYSYLTFWVKRVGGTKGTLYMSISNSTSNYTSTVAYGALTNDSWAYVTSWMPNIAGSTSNTQIDISVHGTPDGDWYIDDVLWGSNTSISGTETCDTGHLYQNFSYTPSAVYGTAGLQTRFITWDTNSWSNITNIVATVDGTLVNCDYTARRIYVDTSGLSATTHQINITAYNTTTLTAPDVNFTANVTNGSAPLTVRFSDNTNWSVSKLNLTSADMEAGLPPGIYAAYANYSISTDYAHSGTYSIKVTGTNATAYDVVTLWCNNIDITASQSYYWSTYVYSPVTTYIEPNAISIVELQGGWRSTARGNINGSGSLQQIEGGKWYKIEGYDTTPSDWGVGATGYSFYTICARDADGDFNTSQSLYFDDFTVTPVDSVSYNFGDGNTSSTVSDTHTYYNTGTYNVSYTVTANTLSDTETKTSYITIVSIPTANFTSNTSTGKNPLTVQFTDTSTGSPTSWSWNFGDGTTSTSQNPVHTYTESYGLYTVSLNATNAYGSNVNTKPNYMYVLDPQCAFISNASDASGTIIVGNIIHFNETNQYSNTTKWYVNNVLKQTNNNVNNSSYNYTTLSTGVLNVSAIINNRNTNAMKTWTYTIVDNVSSYFVGTPTSGNIPLTVTFTDGTEGNPTAWQWSFGDGTANATTQNATHTYTNAGTYTVTLTASNNLSSQTYISYNYITAIIPTPVCSFRVSPTAGNVPFTAHFTDTSTKNPTSWLWDFGDGATSTSQNPSHIYTTVGTYTVTLTATNGGGSSTSTQTRIIHTGGVGPVAEFTNNKSSGTVPMVVLFTDTSTGSPTSVVWDFGDGITSSHMVTATHTYTRAGTYNVKLTATNAYGSDTVTKTGLLTVNSNGSVSGVQAGFTTNGATTTIVNNTVAFNSSTLGTPDSIVYDFGDGTTSTDPNPTHAYSSPGTYDVTISVTNGSVVSNYSQPVTIVVTAPNNYSQYYQKFFTPNMGGWDFVSHTSDFWTSVVPSSIFWLIILFIPYITIYNRTGTVVIPAVLYLFIGGALATVMPPFLGQMYFWFIVLGAGGVIYKLFVGD